MTEKEARLKVIALIDSAYRSETEWDASYKEARFNLAVVTLEVDTTDDAMEYFVRAGEFPLSDSVQRAYFDPHAQ